MTSDQALCGAIYNHGCVLGDRCERRYGHAGGHGSAVIDTLVAMTNDQQAASSSSVDGTTTFGPYLEEDYARWAVSVNIRKVSGPSLTAFAAGYLAALERAQQEIANLRAEVERLSHHRETWSGQAQRGQGQ